MRQTKTGSGSLYLPASGSATIGLEFDFYPDNIRCAMYRGTIASGARYFQMTNLYIVNKSIYVTIYNPTNNSLKETYTFFATAEARI